MRARRPAISRYVLEIVAPTGYQAEDFERLLVAGLKAQSVTLRAQVDLSSDSNPGDEPVALPAGPEAVMEVLRDGTPWRVAHLADRMVAEKKAVSKAMALRHVSFLLDIGLVERPRWGVVMLAGVVPPDPGEIPPLRSGADRRLGTSEKKLLDLVAEPKDASALVESLGVTRQRVDQIVKRLLAEDRIRKIEGVGIPPRTMWLRADIGRRAAMAAVSPPIGRARTEVLNTLAADAIHRLDDVVELVGKDRYSVHRYSADLAAEGLAIKFKVGGHSYIGVTPLGLQHPSREASAVRAASADVATDFGEPRLSFIQALSVLGEARTRDIADAVGRVKFNDSAQSAGQIMQRFELTGLAVSPEADAALGNRRPNVQYRLTDAGVFVAGLIARFRPPPLKADLLARMEEERAERAGIHNEHRRRNAEEAGHPPISEGQLRVLQRLSEGPATTPDLAAISGYQNRRSIHLTMVALEQREWVERGQDLQRRNTLIWSITQSGRATWDLHKEVWAVAQQKRVASDNDQADGVG